MDLEEFKRSLAGDSPPAGLSVGGHVRKGEKGNLVVYADRIRRTEIDEESGEEVDRDIPFMKGYTVFNIEQIENLPAQFRDTLGVAKAHATRQI